MSDSFDGIFIPVSKIIKRINTPIITGMIVGFLENTIHNRIPHIEVGMSHINFSPQNTFTLLKLTIFHFLKEGKILLCWPVSIGWFHPGLGESAPSFPNLVGSLMVYISFSLGDKLYCPLIELLKIIWCIAETVPFET